MTEVGSGAAAIASPTPSAARLFGEALEAWTGDQKTFWTVAGGLAAVFGALQYAIDAGWLGRSGSSTWSSAATGYVYAMALDYLLKTMLFPDWPARAKAKAKGAQMSWSFFWFCAAYGFAATILTLLLIAPFLSSLLAATREHGGGVMILAALAQPPVMAVLALLFSRNLLFLPGQSAGTAMTLEQASAAGRPIRGTLALFALLCVVLGVVSYVATIGFVLLRLPDAPLSTALLRAVVSAIDVFVLYVLAHGLATLFRRQTGWTPPPLAVSAS
jgi:hypothetical protein